MPANLYRQFNLSEQIHLFILLTVVLRGETTRNIHINITTPLPLVI